MATRHQVMASLERHVERRVVEVATNVHGLLQASTPVDTGFARANWQISTGEPADGTVPVGAAVVLPSYRLADGSVYIANNAQYIQRLNAGSSSQAPAAFVEQAIAEGARL